MKRDAKLERLHLGRVLEAEFLVAFDARASSPSHARRSSNEQPWQTVKGEFRSATVTGKQGDCWERNQAVIRGGRRSRTRRPRAASRAAHGGVRQDLRILTEPYGTEIVPVPA